MKHGEGSIVSTFIKRSHCRSNLCKVLILVTLLIIRQTSHLGQLPDNCTTGETLHHRLQAVKAAISVRLYEVSLFAVCFRVRSTGYVDKFVLVRQIENRPHARRWRTGG